MGERCLLCGDPAIAVYRLPEGCWCHPGVTVQPLCPQHVVRAHPLGGMELVSDLRADRTFAVPELGLPADPTAAGEVAR